MSVWGSLRGRNISEGSGRDPDWDCYIDGANVGQPWTYPTGPTSNFALCLTEDLRDGSHTLELKTTIRSETLWVDQVQYRASINVDVSNAWMEVRHGDGRFKYSGDWQERSDGYGIATMQNGARFLYEFNGAPSPARPNVLVV